MPSMNLALTGTRIAKALASIPTRLITFLRRPVSLKQQVSNANEHKACQDLDFNDSVEYSKSNLFEIFTSFLKEKKWERHYIK